jgi:chromosome segregation ATPase
MSTVEQIHHLETRVDRLLVTLRELRAAHDSLRSQLASSEERAADLESRLAASESARQDADRRGDELEQRLNHLHAEQEEIEATITRTLDQLGKLEIGASGEAADDDDAGAAPAGKASVVVAEEAEAEAEELLDDDGPVAEAALLHDADDEQPAADQPEADADNRGGDELDIF